MRAVRRVLRDLVVAVIAGAIVALIVAYASESEKLWLWIGLGAGAVVLAVLLVWQRYAEPEHARPKTAMYDVDELTDAQIEDEFTTADQFLRAGAVKGFLARHNIHLPGRSKTDASEEEEK